MPFEVEEYIARRDKKGTHLIEPVIFHPESPAYDDIILPAGEISDLSSNPRIIKPFYSNDNFAIALAGILHDWLYGQDRRKHADALYREALMSLGMGRIKANIAYAGLRMGGWTKHKPKAI